MKIVQNKNEENIVNKKVTVEMTFGELVVLTSMVGVTSEIQKIESVDKSIILSNCFFGKDIKQRMKRELSDKQLGVKMYTDMETMIESILKSEEMI